MYPPILKSHCSEVLRTCRKQKFSRFFSIPLLSNHVPPYRWTQRLMRNMTHYDGRIIKCLWKSKDFFKQNNNCKCLSAIIRESRPCVCSKPSSSWDLCSLMCLKKGKCKKIHFKIEINFCGHAVLPSHFSWWHFRWNQTLRRLKLENGWCFLNDSLTFFASCDRFCCWWFIGEGGAEIDNWLFI